jgi:hypothetical protein
VTDTSRLERALPWVLRLIWIGVLVAGGGAIDEATSSSAEVVGDVARATAFAGWFVGVCAMAIPSVVSLTATRLVLPLSMPVATLTSLTGADAVSSASFLVTAVLSTMLALSAIMGRAFVQASAYGEEDRHLLRPPAAYGLAALVTWLLWGTAVISSPLLLAHERWILGAAATVVAIVGGLLGWPRWHRLANRWFVVVPIGIVIHDAVVLAETVMLRRQEIAAVRLAPAGTTAADLTGPASGNAVEITTHESTTAIYAATPKQPRGTAIHLTACLVAPSRPGQALRSAARRRLPVG